jgi:adenylate kinase family enzyme
VPAYLAVIYGPPFAGKSSVARELARSIPGKSAVVSLDGLLRDSIVVPDENWAGELEMVHTQARLLVANYLKNRYHVVVEGAFYYEREGALQRYEQEIDQLVSLMRNLTYGSLVVQLGASEEELRRRAQAMGRDDDVAAALSIADVYKPRYGGQAITIDTSGQEAVDVANAIRARLLGE